MREKANRIHIELNELKSLLLTNENFIINSLPLDDHNKYWIITHTLSGSGINYINEKEGHYEGGLARECCALFQFLENIKTPPVLRIRKLCSIIFYTFMGYRIQDANKAPDMVKSFTGKSLLEILSCPRKYETESQKRNRLSIEEAKKQAREKPNLLSNVLVGLPITLIICYVLGLFYSGSDLYSFRVFVVIGTLLGLLGIEGHYHLLSWFAIRVRYYYFISKWRLTWKCFEYPSKLKYYFEDKRMYIYPFFFIWYLITYLIAR